MGSKVVVLVKSTTLLQVLPPTTITTRRLLRINRKLLSTKAAAALSNTSSNLQPPDVSRLAQTARISLTQQEVEEFGPKIRQLIDWFGQLQNVDLDSVEPAIRAATEGGNARQDIPETFDNKDAIITAIPSYEEPYIKVPTVLNKE